MKSFLLILSLIACLMTTDILANTQSVNGNKDEVIRKRKGSKGKRSAEVKVRRGRKGSDQKVVSGRKHHHEPGRKTSPGRRGDYWNDSHGVKVRPGQRDDYHPRERVRVRRGRRDDHHREDIVVRQGEIGNVYDRNDEVIHVRRGERDYRRYVHRPITRIYPNHRRFTVKQYVRYLRNSEGRDYIWKKWILRPTSLSDGHYYLNNYPYYVYNGHLHRYSWNDYCTYELVDEYHGVTVYNTHNYNHLKTCAAAYNQCALMRDQRNNQDLSYRYFCAEVGYTRQKPNHQRVDHFEEEYCHDYDDFTDTCYDDY